MIVCVTVVGAGVSTVTVVVNAVDTDASVVDVVAVVTTKC